MQSLSSLVENSKHKWLLENIKLLLGSPHTNNQVFSAFSSKYNCEIILKIIPSTKTFSHEQNALLYFNGKGCVKLLDHDAENFSLLLESIKPGTPLSKLFPNEDSKATETCAQVIKKLHQKPLRPSLLPNFPSIKSWLNLLNTFKDNKVPSEMLKKAQILTADLLQSQRDLYLLHGDLHHENILQQDNSWIAIDPEGGIGELAYEFGAFIRNPIPLLLEQNDPGHLMMQRAECFSKIFKIETRRILEWSFVQAMLATCWSIQDESDNLDYWLKIADLLEDTL